MKMRFAGIFAACLLGAASALAQTIQPATNGSTPGGSAGGDLSGSYPNPTVSKVNGVSPTTGNSSSAVVETDINGNYASYGIPSAQIITCNHASSPCSLVCGDKLTEVDTTGGSVTLKLPNPSTYCTLIIKDYKGNFGTTAPTLQQYSSETIEGVAASITLNANWGNYEFQSDGTNWIKTSASSNRGYWTQTTHGTYSWTGPAGVTSVNVCGRAGSSGGAGGGAGGGGSTSSGAGSGGGGGNGGSTI